MTPAPGDMPEDTTFTSEPLSTELVHDHLRELLPCGKKPESMRQAV